MYLAAWCIKISYIHAILHYVRTLRTLLEERSILSEQGSIFLENGLSEQAELSEQGGISFKNCSPSRP